MPQQLELHRLDLETLHEPQRRGDRAHGAERLLVAMAVQHDLAGVALAIGLGMRPAAASRASSSSMSSAWPASASASSPGSIAGSSSRRVKRQEGSSPTMGTPRSTNGRAAASSRRASARASSTRPAERNVRPQHSGRPPSAAASGTTR